MDELTGSIIGQKSGFYTLEDYTTTRSDYAGYTSQGRYAYILKFKTPAFSGLSIGVSFGIYMSLGVGESVKMRHAICSSDANAESYMGTASAVNDPNQIETGTTSFAGMTSEITKKTFTIGTTELKPSTTYYLVLWCYNDTGVSINPVESAWGEHSTSLAYAQKYTLSINAAAGSVVTVKRTSSPSGSTGTLSNGSAVYYGDKLTITFSAKVGYDIGACKVNGSAFASGGTHTVKSNVKVTSAATVKSFKISVKPGNGSTITVSRTKSPLQGAGTGKLVDGDSIYYNDVLKIAFDSSNLYEILTSTVNGKNFATGGTHTATGNVSIVTTTRMLGFVYLTVGGVNKRYRVVVYRNKKWRKYRPVILHSGSNISAIGIEDSIVVSTSLLVSKNAGTIIIGGD